jgi:protoporphyrin/coproporphyrin ferrochelatase
MTTGVLLATYGAPHDDDDVPAYLHRIRGDVAPDVVAEMRRRYRVIGGSPLVRITREQAAALEADLGVDYRVRAGMRFSDPTVAAAFEELVSLGADHVVAVPMSPQWSPTLMSGYERAIDEARTRGAAAIPVTLARGWHTEGAFIAALAEVVRAAQSRSDGGSVVALTAHSLPRRVYEGEPEYVAALRETAELVARAAGLADWVFAYQSAGHTAEEWLRPDLKDLLPDLAARGAREVIVAPVQFLADHLEVLYDLDVAVAAEAEQAGLRYRRVPMPNTRPSFIAALAGIVRRASRALDTSGAVRG